MTSNPSLGHFVWFDLMTQDATRAKAYYSELFGWEIQQVDTGPMPYSMFSIEGEICAGVVDLSAVPQAAGAPAHWMGYIEVADCRQAEARCMELGGTVIQPTNDIPGHGSLAVLQDPTGGVFSAWTSEQPKPPRGWEQMKPGMVCWTELITSDVDAARAFYKEMLGWQEDEMPMEDGTIYYVQKAGETGLGGIMKTPMEGIPTHWSYYFLTTSVDEWNQRALDLGGNQIKEPTDIPGTGRFSILSDPTGAVFALYEPAQGAESC